MTSGVCMRIRRVSKWLLLRLYCPHMIERRIRAVDVVLGPIRSFKKRIESQEEARSIPGVGEKTAKKASLRV
jgi:hypothetical protein